jgi:hypothetical protein
MGRRVKFFVGALLASAGAVIALYPFLSVWQVAGQALEELPEVQGVESSDTSHGVGALLDSSFVLATRSYSNTTQREVQSALTSSGFEAANINGSLTYARECCGEYDAIWVSVADADEDGVVVATATAADGDIQITAVFFVLFGLALFVAGAVIAVISFGQRNGVPSRDIGGTSVPAGATQ